MKRIHYKILSILCWSFALLDFFASSAFAEPISTAMALLYGGLGGGALAGLGSFLGGKGGEQQQPLIPRYISQTGQNVADWVGQYINQYQPGKEYGGQFTAPMTGFESNSLDLLKQYMSAPNTGELFGLSKSHLMDTLSGKYADPETSPYIQAMTNLAAANLEKQTDLARRGQGARGTFYTKSGIQEERRLREDTQNYLNALIGQFIQGERGNMLRAVPQAAKMDEYESALAPLKKIGAGQTLGSLERIIQQADLERKYNDFKRQQSELSGVPGVGTSLFGTGTNVPYGIQNWQAPGADWGGMIGSIAPLLMSSLKMGAGSDSYSGLSNDQLVAAINARQGG